MRKSQINRHDNISTSLDIAAMQTSIRSYFPTRAEEFITQFAVHSYWPILCLFLSMFVLSGRGIVQVQLFDFARSAALFILAGNILAILLIAWRLKARIKQIPVKHSRWAVECLKREKPFILLLYSFNETWHPKIGVPGLTLSEQVYLGKNWDLEELLIVGAGMKLPFVAVGPQRGQRFGAERLNVPDQDWKEEVNELMEKAALIFLMPADSAGVSWEANHIGKKMRILRKCVLVRGTNSVLGAKFYMRYFLSRLGVCKEPTSEIILPNAGALLERIIAFDDTMAQVNSLLLAINTPGLSFLATESRSSTQVQLWSLPFKFKELDDLGEFINSMLDVLAVKPGLVSCDKLIETSPSLEKSGLYCLCDLDFEKPEQEISGPLLKKMEQAQIDSIANEPEYEGRIMAILFWNAMLIVFISNHHVWHRWFINILS